MLASPRPGSVHTHNATSRRVPAEARRPGAQPTGTAPSTRCSTWTTWRARGQSRTSAAAATADGGRRTVAQPRWPQSPARRKQVTELHFRCYVLFHEICRLSFIIFAFKSCGLWLLALCCGILWILHFNINFIVISCRSWIFYVCSVLRSRGCWILQILYLIFFHRRILEILDLEFVLLQWDPGSPGSHFFLFCREILEILDPN